MQTFKNSYFKVWVVLSVLILLNLTLVIITPQSRPKIEKYQFNEDILNPQIRIDFSEQMDKDATFSSLNFSHDIPGNFTWLGKSLFFTPKEPLLLNQNYQIEIGTDAQNLAGRKIKQPEFINFKTPGFKSVFIKENQQTKNRQIIIYNDETKTTKQLTNINENIIKFELDATSTNMLAISKSKDTNDKLILIENFQEKAIQKNLIPNKQISPTKINNFHFLQNPQEIAISFEEDGENKISIYNTKTKTFVELVKQSNQDNRVFIAPNGQELVFVDKNNNMQIINIQTKKEDLVATNFKQIFGFSTTGKHIIYTQEITTSAIPGAAKKPILILQNSTNKIEILGDQENITQIANIDFNYSDEKMLITVNRNNQSEILLLDITSAPFKTSEAFKSPLNIVDAKFIANEDKIFIQENQKSAPSITEGELKIIQLPTFQKEAAASPINITGTLSKIIY